MQKYDTTFKAFKAFQPPFKLTDEQINWTDEVGNTILHYAAWTGNIYLARHIFENAQSLIEIANNKGATPIALAIIATQVIFSTFWELSHVIFLMLKKLELLAKLIKFTK